MYDNSKPLMIVVETYVGDADEPEMTRTINHNDPLHRQWLGKHTYWAFRNQRAIHTCPLEQGTNS